MAAGFGGVSMKMKSYLGRRTLMGWSRIRVLSINLESCSSSLVSSERDGMRCTLFGIFLEIMKDSGSSSVVSISRVPAKLCVGTPRCLVAPAAGSRSMMRDL